MGHGHGQHGVEMRNYSSPYPARSMSRCDIAGVSIFFLFYFFFFFKLFFAMPCAKLSISRGDIAGAFFLFIYSFCSWPYPEEIMSRGDVVGASISQKSSYSDFTQQIY
jgi:hypothetical protein